MWIYEFDTEDRIQQVYEKYQYVCGVEESLADYRSEYREFASKVDLEFSYLEECCRTFKKNLLIDIYTFSEQLFKNFYYEMIEKDGHSNNCLNSFINNKLPVERFSPNVKYKNIQNSICNELIPGFSFVLKEQVEEIKKYNNLIGARHQYAHTGDFMYEYKDYYDVILVEKYLVSELEMVIKIGCEKRNIFYNNLKEVIEKCQKLKNELDEYENKKNQQLKIYIKREIKVIRNLIKKILDEYENSPLKSELMIEIYNAMKDIDNIDLRRFSDSCDVVNKLYFVLLEKRFFNPIKGKNKLTKDY